MTISYEWLSAYLPEKIEPARLSKILTSIGLEVEKMEKHSGHHQNFEGLVVGEIMGLSKHPNADKLSITKVNIGQENLLTIICGASNVALTQKVVVARPGTILFPFNKDSFSIKTSKIRGEISEGMLCAEDEIGISANHDGIIVLPADAIPGTSIDNYFKKEQEDWIIEIGLTPNRMDAMSHIGVAKDVCAYLSHHGKKEAKVILPYQNAFKPDIAEPLIEAVMENTTDCLRYTCTLIEDVKVQESPEWLQSRLKAISLHPINNIVDITNFILHETGQPLHAFDHTEIKGDKVIIKNVAAGTPFTTLDGKERILNHEDLMICNAEAPICIAGVFGGMNSGITKNTKSVLLESAFFSPSAIRKTSTRLGLRTDAAMHFEKGVDISNTLQVLKRAALLIRELAGGKIHGLTDIYPTPIAKKEIALKYQYLKKISGKNYHPESIKKILENLEFEIVKEIGDTLWVAVPFSKMDILQPADIVEEIIRIDGLDQIEIPDTITISPASNEHSLSENMDEKLSAFFASQGFHEIVTNSLTNSNYFSKEDLAVVAKPYNSISKDLDILKPEMLPTALEAISFNLKRKMKDLKLFEKGKTYAQSGMRFIETPHFCVYVTGTNSPGSWLEKQKEVDFYYIKGLANAALQLIGINDFQISAPKKSDYGTIYEILNNQNILGFINQVEESYLQKFEINQTVFCIDLFPERLLEKIKEKKFVFTEITKFPTAIRDLAILSDEKILFIEIESAIKSLQLAHLQEIHLFDVFRSEKLGAGKKSFAISLAFNNPEKTLTDEEIDMDVQRIIAAIETKTGSEIRKS